MLRTLFDDADADHGGTVTLQEFKELLSNPRVKTELSILEIEVPDAEMLFHLLDDGDGQMHVNEFISGALHVRGTARASDIVALAFSNARMISQLKDLERYVRGPLMELLHSAQVAATAAGTAAVS